MPAFVAQIALLLHLYLYSILSIDLPNSCVNHPDTDNLLIQPIDDDIYPALNVKCSNGFMIIDINKDPNWLQYFTSHRLYHYAAYGPIKDDHSNWDEWFLPPASDYLVSPDCSECLLSNELNANYRYRSSYYMTPTASQCTQIPISRIACDMDYNTYECRVCGTGLTRKPGYWTSYPVYNGLNDDGSDVIHDFNEITQMADYHYGLCLFTIRNARAMHSDDSFTHCKTVTHEDLKSEAILPRRKPSIGGDGRFCMCAKPEYLGIYSVDSEEETYAQNVVEEEEEDASDTQDVEENVYELYQSDFTDGTYRITSAGSYKIMENIVFDFKAPTDYLSGDLSTYNGESDWWPTIDQNDAYPGAGGNDHAYFLGFWAGITIECSDVILDLNGFALEMSLAFYYQQSFFALISLSSQVFLPGEGPGFFGAKVDAAEDVIIRDGELGLSSHHAIQGNLNKNVRIENMKIHSFKTHAVQLNGFDGVSIKDVDIGPNMQVDKLSPFYAHMRHLLGTYKRMESENEDAVNDLCLTFYGRSSCVTLHALIVDIQTLLDIAFEYAVFGKIPFSEDTDSVDEYKLALWQQNGDVLLNAKGSPQTATLYGIFLNYVGSNVVGWYAGSESTQSQNVWIENVQIHDLHHNTLENIAFSQGANVGKQRILNCLAAPFNAYHIFGEEQVHKMSQCNNYMDDNQDSAECVAFYQDGLQYVGNKIVDIQIFAFKLIADYGLSWDYCSGGASDMNALSEFAFDNQQFEEFSPLLVVSHDPMIHPGKGPLGLRLNGVDNAHIKDVVVNNIKSTTDIGTMLAGAYENAVAQQAPYMNGFSMNMAHGMSLTFVTNCVLSNVQVNNIVSNTGLAYGIALWYNTNVQITDGITVNYVHAGKELEKSDQFTQDSYPNLEPEACGIRIYDDDSYQVVVDYDEDLVDMKCIFGHTGCLMEDSMYSHVGEVKNDECQLLDGIQVEHEYNPPLGIRNYLGHVFVLLISIVSGALTIFYCSHFIKDCYDDKMSFKPYELAPLL